MIKIAHRGNLNGSSPLENSPGFLLEAISKNFDVEVDIRLTDTGWFLGHDGPVYKVGDLFIDQIKDSAWFHCKNLEALEKLDNKVYKYFWHQNDDFTLTSNGFIWTYPNKTITTKSIIVDLNLDGDYHYTIPYGICTDYANLL